MGVPYTQKNTDTYTLKKKKKKKYPESVFDFLYIFGHISFAKKHTKQTE